MWEGESTEDEEWNSQELIEKFKIAECYRQLEQWWVVVGRCELFSHAKTDNTHLRNEFESTSYISL